MMRELKQKNAAMTRKTAVLLIFVALSACSPKVDTRGYVSNVAFKERITIGQTSKDQVLEQFGSPSSQSTFGPETWYYITSHKETVAFLEPEVVKQEVAGIEFDAAGIAAAVKYFDETNSQELDLVKRTTPTEGHAMGFVEQVLGNIGRFNRPSGDSVVPGRKPGGY